MKQKKLSEEFIDKHADKIDWYLVAQYQKLSEEFIDKHSDKLSVEIVSRKIKLSEGFINKYSDKVDWYYISQYRNLSKEFIERHSDKLDWNYLSRHHDLSEELIGKYSDKVSWGWIFVFQKLSEEFLERHLDKVQWVYVSQYQKLSEEFIERHGDKVNWYCVSLYQKLSPEFINKHNLAIPESSWMYKDKEWKRERILSTRLYEIVGDKVIAYKSCKKDGSSIFNNQYRYEVGETYESRADYNEDDGNSFGLSAWDKKGALGYYNDGKLFKVEIDLEDIACIVHGGGKIRASKIKVVEEIKID